MKKKVRKPKVRIPMAPPAKPFKVRKEKNKPKKISDEELEV